MPPTKSPFSFVLRALVRIHFELYQSALSLLGLTAVLHILLAYTWGYAASCGAVTVASFWLGQGVVALIQHGAKNSAGRRSLD